MAKTSNRTIALSVIFLVLAFIGWSIAAQYGVIFVLLLAAVVEVAFLSREKAQASSAPPASSPERIACPCCGEMIAADAVLCRFCRATAKEWDEARDKRTVKMEPMDPAKAAQELQRELRPAAAPPRRRFKP